MTPAPRMGWVDSAVDGRPAQAISRGAGVGSLRVVQQPVEPREQPKRRRRGR